MKKHSAIEAPKQEYRQVTCSCCNFTWTPRVPKPVECPDCKTRLRWDTDRKTKEPR